MANCHSERCGWFEKNSSLFLWLKRESRTATQVQEGIREQAPPKSQQKTFTIYFLILTTEIVFRLKVIGGQIKTSVQNAVQNVASGATPATPDPESIR